MSFRTRLALLVAASVAVAVLAVAGTVLWLAREEARGALDHQLRDRVEALKEEALRHGFDRLPAPLRSRAIGRYLSYDVMVQLIDSDGQIRYFSDLPLPVTDTDVKVAFEQSAKTLWTNRGAEGVRLRVVTEPLGARGALMVARPLDELDTNIEGLREAVILVAGAGVLGAGLLGYWVAARAIRPVRRLTAAARNVAATQDFDQPIELERDDELGELARSFNAMLEALGTSRAQQHRLVADAGHELRTPLTSIRTNIELLARSDAQPDAQSDAQPGASAPGVLDPAERRRMLDDVQFELDQLTELVAELVELATDSRTQGPAVRVDLADLAASVCQRHQRRTSTELVTTLVPCPVMVNEALMERAIGNLIDNAMKWSPPHERVDITVGASDGYGWVRVRDRGPGIEPSQREIVFERFYRAPEARSAPGSGLGLSIVDYAARTHDGSASIIETDGPGATVEIRLPLSQDPPD